SPVRPCVPGSAWWCWKKPETLAAEAPPTGSANILWEGLGGIPLQPRSTQTPIHYRRNAVRTFTTIPQSTESLWEGLLPRQPYAPRQYPKNQSRINPLVQSVARMKSLPHNCASCDHN